MNIKKSLSRGTKAAWSKYQKTHHSLLKSPIYRSGFSRLEKRLKKIYRNTHISEEFTYYVNNFDQAILNEDLILFDSFWGRKIACNPYAIFQEIVKSTPNNKYRFIWVKNVNVESPIDVSNNPNVSFVQHGSIDYYEALLTAKYLVGNSTFVRTFTKKPGQIYMNTWHGVPLKRLGFASDPTLLAPSNTQKNFNAADYVVMSGRYSSDMVPNQYKARKDNIFELGQARIDSTLNSNPAEVFRKTGLSKNKPILLYAPTWRGTVAGVSDDFSIELSALKHLKTELEKEFEIYISLHNYVEKKLSTYIEGFNQIPSNIDINEFMSVVDTLITDYSSVFIDYLVLDRPIVLFIPDYQEYKATRGLCINIDELPVNVVNHINDLSSTVRNSLKPSSFQHYRKYKTLFLPYEDGNSAQRAVTLLLNKPIFDTKTNKLKVDKQNQKKKILFYPGSLKNNGITKSFIALTGVIDHSIYEVYVVLDASANDRQEALRKNFDSLDQSVTPVLRTYRKFFTRHEEALYEKFSSTGKHDSTEDERIVNNAFHREARRVFGDLSFDYVVDYSGFSLFYTSLLMSMDCDQKIIFHHTDMHSEAFSSNVRTPFGTHHPNSVFSLYKHYDAFVSVSESIKNSNSKNFAKFYAKNATHNVLGNSILYDEIINQSKEAPFGLSKNALIDIKNPRLVTFVCVARLSTEKNHARLLHAFQAVLQENPESRLYILGEGILEKELKLLANKLRIKDQTHFTGYVENPYSIMSRCDCLVASSNYEGQGIVFLEALALNLPCIGTNVVGIKSALANGVGELVEPDSKSLAKAMINFSLSGINFQNKRSAFDLELYLKNYDKQFKTIFS